MVTKYLDYPVLSWRKLFKEADNQLQEYDDYLIKKEDQINDFEYSKNVKSSSKEGSFSY